MVVAFPYTSSRSCALRRRTIQTSCRRTWRIAGLHLCASYTFRSNATYGISPRCVSSQRKKHWTKTPPEIWQARASLPAVSSAGAAFARCRLRAGACSGSIAFRVTCGCSGRAPLQCWRRGRRPRAPAARNVHRASRKHPLALGPRPAESLLGESVHARTGATSTPVWSAICPFRRVCSACCE